MDQHTIDLLKECSSGCDMAVKSVDQVMDFCKDDRLCKMLSAYKDKHKDLARRITDLLRQGGKEPEGAGKLATAMAWTNIEMKMFVEADNHQIAKVMMDGCNMGIQSVSEYINKYPEASPDAVRVAKEIVDVEEKFMQDLKAFV